MLALEKQVWQEKRTALSIQQKFRFEISEIPRAHSSCTDPTQATARLVIVFVSRIQNSGTGDNNFVKWKRTFRSDRPTEMTRPVKVDNVQNWSRIFRSNQTEMVRSIWCTNRNFRNFGLNRKRPRRLTSTDVRAAATSESWHQLRASLSPPRSTRRQKEALLSGWP